MRPFLAALILTVGSASPVQAQARDLLGMHAGMTAGEAVGIFSKYGKVEKINAPGIGVTYIGGRYSATLCNNSNIVRNIDHYLGPDCSGFFKIGQIGGGGERLRQIQNVFG